ncbi:hypothetical protein FQR65_LT05451 [Abscondita terminalis]|nr:hypothetical protein FQR65_LT05451 [Abscondita terminalis]
MSLTILAMVKEKRKDPIFNVTETLCFDDNNSTHVEPINYEGTLDWSFNQQYYVLTSFDWGNILFHFVSGILIQKYGSKVIFGWSLLVTSLCNLCIPVTCSINYILIVVLHFMQGAAQAFSWPALYAVMGIWIPIQEKSRFVTLFHGSVLGVTLTNLAAGFVIAKFSWAFVFYGTGGLGLLSALSWYFLMENKPEQHPRISKQELKYIQENRVPNLHSKKVIPWISIFTSLPVWAIAITSFGRMWIISTFKIYGPLYFETVIGANVANIGLILGMSNFVGFISSIFFSVVSDKIIAYNLIPLVYNRKMFSVVGHIVAGIMIVVLGHVNCNIPLIITIWYLIQAFLAVNFIGTMTNIVDISPSYAGPVSSVIQTVLLLPTVTSTFVVNKLLQNENILLAWRHHFYISCGIVMSTAAFFAIFGSGKVQSWDAGKNSLKDVNVEETLLNS